MRAVRSWLVATCASASAPRPKTLSCMPSTGRQTAACVPCMARLARLPVMLTRTERVMTVPWRADASFLDMNVCVPAVLFILARFWRIT